MAAQRFWNELRQWSTVPVGSLVFPAEPANEVFAGPTSGAAAIPGFRALVAADLPSPFSGGGRILLPNATYPGNNFYYKPTTGSDSNLGTAASPWATPAPLWANYDFGGQAVTLNLLETTATPFVHQAGTGGGSLALDLGGFGLNAVSAHAISLVQVNSPTKLTVQNGSLSVSGSGNFNCIFNDGIGIIAIGNSLSFGTSLLGHIVAAGSGAQIAIPVGYTITGNANVHIASFTDAVIAQANDPASLSGPMITLSGTRSFPLGFAWASGSSNLIIRPFNSSGVNVPPYQITGGGAQPTSTPRFRLDANGSINTLSGGANYFPGTLAGINDGTGVYA